MSIISRFSEIMKANINDLLDKCEDPAKMIDQNLRSMRESLEEVKLETAAVMADEKAAKRRLDECRASIDKYTSAAQNAIRAGKDDDARTLIQEKQRYEANLSSLQKTYDAAHDNAVKIRQMHDKLVDDIRNLEIRKDNIKAKLNVAKAQTRVNKLTSGGKNVNASMDAFARMEAKADRMLDEAAAAAELAAGQESSAENLAEKYASGGSGSPAVDDELAAMKAALAAGQN